MDENTRIRSMNRQDTGAWLVLWSAYLQSQGGEMTRAHKISLFRQLTARGGTVAARIVEQGGSRVGFAIYEVISGRSAPEHRLQIHHLYIRPDHQQSGAGSALINDLYAEAAHHGIMAIHWPTAENIFRGLRLSDAAAVQPTLALVEKAA